MPTTYNMILVKKYQPKQEERVAAGTITPGHLIELTSADKYQVHSTAGGDVVPVIVAEMDKDQGRGINDDYATTGVSTRVNAEVLDPGDHFYGILKDGETAVIGSPLKSAGDGTLQLYTAASGEPDYGRAIVGRALQAVDRSGSSGEDTNTTGRILVMVG